MSILDYHIKNKLELEITEDLGNPYGEKNAGGPILSEFNEKEKLEFYCHVYKNGISHENERKFWKLLLKYKAEINYLEHQLYKPND